MSLTGENMDVPHMEPASSQDSSATRLHAARQPLNRMALTIENIRLRIVPTLDVTNSDYLQLKLNRLDEQLHELHSMIEVFVQD